MIYYYSIHYCYLQGTPFTLSLRKGPMLQYELSFSSLYHLDILPSFWKHYLVPQCFSMVTIMKISFNAGAGAPPVIFFCPLSFSSDFDRGAYEEKFRGQKIITQQGWESRLILMHWEPLKIHLLRHQLLKCASQALFEEEVNNCVWQSWYVCGKRNVGKTRHKRPHPRFIRLHYSVVFQRSITIQ